MLRGLVCFNMQTVQSSYYVHIIALYIMEARQCYKLDCLYGFHKTVTILDTPLMPLCNVGLHFSHIRDDASSKQSTKNTDLPVVTSYGDSAKDCPKTAALNSYSLNFSFPTLHAR